MEYKLHKNEYGEVQECDSCGCEVPTAPFDWGPPYTEQHDTDKRLLCEICATTTIGNRTRNPRDPDSQTAKMLAELGNHLKSKLGL